MTNDLVLLTPGPACTSSRVRQALLRGDLCHREPEFGELLARVRTGLPLALGLPGYEAVLVTGSGTAAMEMAVTSCVRAGRAILVVNNGVYGERLATIARAHGITVYEIIPDGPPLDRWASPASPAAVRAALADHPDIDAVACVHHETTTGLINPVREIGEAAAQADVLFIVDAISSAGNEEQDLGQVHADIVCGSANKGLHSLPGIAFLLCSPAATSRLAEVPARGVYLSAANYLAGQRKGDVPFTPAIQVLYALDEALAEFTEAGGLEARVKLYRERACLVRAGFDRLGLRILVPPARRSNSVTAIALPEAVAYDTLHDQLKQRGYVIYAAQGHLAAGFFRICTMGEIPWSRLEQLEDALGAGISAARKSTA